MLPSVTLRLLVFNITTVIWNIEFSICQEIFNVVTKSQVFLSEGVISEDDSQNPGFLKGWLPSQMRFIQQMFNNQWSLELLTGWTCHCHNECDHINSFLFFLNKPIASLSGSTAVPVCSHKSTRATDTFKRLSEWILVRWVLPFKHFGNQYQ